MSPVEARLLPRTQTFRRRRPLAAWWAAAGIAIAVNLGLVVVLSQISHLHVPPPEAPEVVHTIRQVEPEITPPPPQTPEQPPEMPEEVSLALPPLDLAPPTPDAPVLPDSPSLDVNYDLPVSFPDFTIAKPNATGVESPTPGFGEPDQPAEMESAFDLERHYPRSARLRGITGRSRMRITIDATGVVTDVVVYDGTPAGVFEQATERLARGLRYRPAKRDGKPVVSVKELLIDWTLK